MLLPAEPPSSCPLSSAPPPHLRRAFSRECSHVVCGPRARGSGLTEHQPEKPLSAPVHPTLHLVAVPPRPVQSPVDDEHVAVGSSLFSDPAKIKGDVHDVANKTLTKPGYLGPILLKH